jgi:hypothetical protein
MKDELEKYKDEVTVDMVDAAHPLFVSYCETEEDYDVVLKELWAAMRFGQMKTASQTRKYNSNPNPV